MRIRVASARMRTLRIGQTRDAQGPQIAFFAAALLQQIMMSFLTQEGGRVVITWGATEKDGLVATHKPPETQNKKKALIFMKSQQEVTPENFNDVVFCMESNVNTLEFLSSLASNVYFPVRTETWS